nr:hypothetical protein BaRGS_000424 [Batillaria attramentaria]
MRVIHVYAMTTATAGLVTINTLAVISLDRYYAVVHRLNPRQHTSRWIMGGAVALVWVYSVLWAAAPVLGWGNYILDGIGTTCTFDYLTRTAHNRSFVLSITVGNFVLPLAVIVFCYVRIGMVTLDMNRTLRLQKVYVSVGLKRRQLGLQADVRTAGIIFVLVVAFLISWLPYLVICLIGLFGDQSRVTVLSSVLPSVVAKASTAMNPVLYSISHPKVRRKLKSALLQAMSPIRKRGSNSGTTNTELSGSNV